MMANDIHTATCDVCKGTKKSDCYSCLAQGILYFREDRPLTHVELEMKVSWLRRINEDQDAHHARELALLAPTDREKELLAQNRALEDRLRLLRRELAIANGNNFKRNVELDALHYVWCDGGCPSGVHRYDDKGPEAISEELVQAGEDGVRRLRTWWENFKCKKARRAGEASGAAESK